MKADKTSPSTSYLEPKDKSRQPNYSKTQKVLIAIACLTLFPLIYFIGRLILYVLS